MRAFLVVAGAAVVHGCGWSPLARTGDGAERGGATLTATAEEPDREGGGREETETAPERGEAEGDAARPERGDEARGDEEDGDTGGREQDEGGRPEEGRGDTADSGNGP